MTDDYAIYVGGIRYVKADRIEKLEADRRKTYEALLKVTRIHDEVEAKLAQQDDLVQAAVAAALTRAAEDVRQWGSLYSGSEDVTDEVANDILALITPDAQAALDRVVAAERERGFWAGRSCGGSKAEIDAALAAIRKGGE